MSFCGEENAFALCAYYPVGALEERGLLQYAVGFTLVRDAHISASNSFDTVCSNAVKAVLALSHFYCGSHHNSTCISPPALRQPATPLGPKKIDKGPALGLDAAQITELFRNKSHRELYTEKEAPAFRLQGPEMLSPPPSCPRVRITLHSI
ncbi:hypothetical protein Emag_005636 [Eimeria magna]